MTTTAEDINKEFDQKREALIKQLTPISVVGANSTDFPKSTNFQGALVFTIHLDRVPSNDWVQLFQQACHVPRSASQRESNVLGDCIKVIIGSGDDLQFQIDIVKDIISSANQLAAIHLNNKALPKLELERKNALSELKSVNDLQAKAKNLRF